MITVLFSGVRSHPLARQQLRRAILYTFRYARRKPTGSVSIIFVSGAQMRALNRRWRKLDRATDVLSFAPAKEMHPVVVQKAETDWGDLFLAPAYIHSAAKRQHHNFREELLRVTIHGMLHLFAYDHATSSQERRMFGLQERILSQVLKRV